MLVNPPLSANHARRRMCQRRQLRQGACLPAPAIDGPEASSGDQLAVRLPQYAVFGAIGARALGWQPQATDCRRNSCGPGMIGILQARKGCVGQDRARPGNSVEQNRAFFIGD
jgi:hypothetical protein